MLTRPGRGRTAKSKYMDGKIKLNGQVFDVVCDCSKAWKQRVAEQQKKETPNCVKASKFKIKRVDWSAKRSPEQITAHEVRKFLGLPSQLEFVNARERYFTELDTRGAEPAISTVGGDAGEFVLALQVFASECGHDVGDVEALRYFRAYMNATMPRKFYLHHNTEAKDRLAAKMQVEGLNLANPTQELQGRLLGECASNEMPPCGLMAPEFVGDANLKLMLLNEGRYLVDPAVTRAAIKAFYTVLWDKEKSDSDRVRFEEVIGEAPKQERGLINIMTSEGCKMERRVPLLRTQKGDTAMFINSVDAVEARRVDLAAFFTRMAAGHCAVSQTNMVRTMQRLGQRMYANTAEMLLNGRPIYDVHIL